MLLTMLTLPAAKRGRAKYCFFRHLLHLVVLTMVENHLKTKLDSQNHKAAFHFKSTMSAAGGNLVASAFRKIMKGILFGTFMANI